MNVKILCNDKVELNAISSAKQPDVVQIAQTLQLGDPGPI